MVLQSSGNERAFKVEGVGLRRTWLLGCFRDFRVKVVRLQGFVRDLL